MEIMAIKLKNKSDTISLLEVPRPPRPEYPLSCPGTGHAWGPEDVW